MVEEKYIGMALAMSSSLLIGTSFVLTKKGLMDTTSKYGSATEGLKFFKNALWWAGMATMGLGEFANFAAYSFAPAILVTPLGALSVIVGAVLASIFLGERINTIGKSGCALCLMGSVIVVLNAPRDGDIESIEQIMHMAVQPPFLTYAVVAVSFLSIMIFKVAGRCGAKNPLVYLSICSIAGSLTVTACKAFGIALKLTFAGNNQFVHFSTYFFAAIVGLCIAVQMNYFNKALEQFDTNIVTPIYYVFFTSATILASVALFQGFTDSTAKELVSLFCGFITIFIGVFILNATKGDAHDHSTHRPIPLDDEDNVSPTFASRRLSRGSGLYEMSDFDEFSDPGNPESYPMRERSNSSGEEKFRSLNRRHTFSNEPNRDTINLSSDGFNGTSSTQNTYSSSSKGQAHTLDSNSSIAPSHSEAHNNRTSDDIHIDIPLSPTLRGPDVHNNPMFGAQ